jgi:hypothetical protein
MFGCLLVFGPESQFRAVPWVHWRKPQCLQGFALFKKEIDETGQQDKGKLR